MYTAGGRGGGGGRVFLGDHKLFGKGQGEFTRRGEGRGLIFSPLIEERKHFFVFFL